jgi:hypothetical protein
MPVVDPDQVKIKKLSPESIEKRYKPLARLSTTMAAMFEEFDLRIDFFISTHTPPVIINAYPLMQ